MSSITPLSPPTNDIELRALRQHWVWFLVMGIALHPYIVGQPYRLRHLRRALRHIAKAKKVWFTTPGKICELVSS